MYPAPNRVARLSFRLELWVCEYVVAGRILRFINIKNELSQAKFGYHIGAPDAKIPQNSVDFHDESNGTGPGTWKRVKTIKTYRSGQSYVFVS